MIRGMLCKYMADIWLLVSGIYLEKFLFAVSLKFVRQDHSDNRPGRSSKQVRLHQSNTAWFWKERKWREGNDSCTVQ